MASTRELWILLRARDEASRVVHSFSKNVRAAAMAAQAAQKSAEAAAIRQRAQMLKSNGATAQNIRAINDQVIGLEKQARAQTAAAARAREFRAEQMKTIDATVRSNNRHASSLEKQAKALTLAAAMGEEQRTNLIRVTGATEDQVKAIDDNISAVRKRAATLNAEAAVRRSSSASLIAQLQEEQTGLDGSIRSYERRAAAIRSQAAILRNSAAEQTSSLNNQVRALTNQAAALDRQANSFRQAANRAREHDVAMRHLRETLGKVSEGATVAAFSLATIGAAGVIGIKKSVDAAVEYQRQVRLTATQVDQLGGSIDEIGKIGLRVATSVGVSFNEVQGALYDIFSSMDVSVKESEKLLTGFAKAAVAGQTDIQSVSRGTIGILNSFHLKTSDINKVLDLQFKFIQKGVGTYDEWAKKINLVSPSAARAGQSLETMIAALASASRMSGVASRAGTAVARSFDAISNPNAVKALKAIGVSAVDAKGNFRPFVDIMFDFRKELQKIPGNAEKTKAIFEVFKGAGGTIEARRYLQALLLVKGNLEDLSGILDSTKGAAGSLDKAYGMMSNTAAAKTELMKNKFQALKIAIGDALLPQFTGLIDTISKVLDSFNKLPDHTKKTIAQFILWGSVITLVLAALFGFIAVAAVVAAAIGTIGAAAAITIGVVALLPVAIVALGAAFIAAYKNSESFRNAVKQAADNIKQLWDIAVNTARGIKDSWDQNVGPPLQKIVGIVKNSLLPTFREFVAMYENEVIPKIKEAGRIIKDLADGAFKKIGQVIDGTVVPAVEKLSEWWKKHGDELQPLLTILGQVMKWFLIIAAVITGVLVVALVGPLVAAVGLVIGAFQLLAMGAATAMDFFKSIPGFFASVGSAIAGFASSVGSFFTGLWNTIVTFFTGVFNWFAQLPGRIMGFITGLPAMLGNLFRTALDNAAYAVGYGVGLIWRFFSQIVPRAIGFVLSLPNRLAVIFTNAYISARSIVSNLVTAVIAFFQALPGRAATAVGRLWASIRGHFDSARTGAATAVSNLVTGAMRFLNEFPGRAATAIYNVYRSILHGFDGAAGWLVSAGEDIIRGVIHGIGNMIGNGVDMAREAAHKMVKGFKDAIKSNSPSKVYMELGKFSMQGYAIGMVRETKNAIKTVKSMTGDIISAAADPQVNLRTALATASTANNSGGDGGRTFEQHITVYTNEIDPRRHAAELGWELERRVP